MAIYVGREEHVRKARRMISDKYGSLTDDRHWPVVADGSRMRFMPIFSGFVKNKEVYEKLKDHLWIQAQSKANDVLIDLNIVDIHEKKSYLDNRSFEQILHSKISEKMPGVPVIKHIIKKP